MTVKQALEAKVDHYVWRRPDAAESRPKNLVLRLLRMAYVIVRDLRAGQLNLRAMGLVYTTLLSIVPLLALSLSVLKGFGVHNEVVPVLRDFFAPLGEKGDEIVDKIFEFVDNTRVGILSSVGIVLLLYTALSMMQKVESALNFIWHVHQPRRFSQRFSDYISVLLIGPVLVVASTGLSGAAMSNDIVEWLARFGPVNILVTLVSWLVPFILAVAAFSFIYILVPNTKVRASSAIAGGVTAAALWKLAGWAFAAFVVSSGRYEAVYSAFATLIVFMIWLYTSWLILMIGAAVAFYHQNPSYLRAPGERATLSPRVREKVALMLMHRIASDFYAGIEPRTVPAVAVACGVPHQAAVEVFGALEQAGLLVRVAGGDEPRYLPGRPLDTTTLASVVAAVRAAEEDGSLGFTTLAAAPGVEAATRELASAIDSALAGRTAKDLGIGINR
jgi:membrane protein